MDDEKNQQGTVPFDFDTEIDKATTPEELGAFDYVVDAALGVPRGVESAVRDTYSLVDDATAWIGQKLTGDEKYDFLPDYTSNFLGESKTTAGKVVEGITEFATLFIPGQGAVTAAAKGTGAAVRAASLVGAGKAVQEIAKVGKFAGLAAGAAADVVMTNEESVTLGNLARDMGFGNVITDFMAIDADDSLVEKKLKGAIEGSILGLGTEGLLKASSPLLKKFTAWRAKSRALAGKLSDEDLTKILDANKFTDEDVTAIKEFQSTLKANEDAALKARAENPDLETVVSVMEDNGHLLHGGDVLSIAKQNFTNVIEVNAKLEQKWLGIMAADKMSRDDFHELLDDVVELTSVTSLQGKSLAALKGQAAVRDAVVTDTSRLTALKKSVADIKKLSDVEIQSYRDTLATLSSPAEVRRYLTDNLSKIPPQTSAKLGEMGLELWKGMLLSNPATHVLNTLGNTFTVLHQPLSRAFSSVFKGDARAIGSAMQELKGLVTNAFEASRFAMKALRRNIAGAQQGGILDSGSKAFVDSQHTQLMRKWSRDYVGAGAIGTAAEYIGKVTSLPFSMLGAMDEGFKQLSSRSRAAGLLYNRGAALGLSGDALQAYIKGNEAKLFRQSGQIMDRNNLFKEGLEEAKVKGIKSTRQAIDYANNYQAKNFDPELAGMKDELVSYTRKVTFQEELTGLTKIAADAAAQHQLVLGWILPFVKTPANVLKYGFNEFLNVKDAARIFRSELVSGDIAIKGEAQARFATSATLIGSVLGFANSGIITGSGPKDPERRNALMATGWQPHSIRFGDKYVSYNRLDPLATPIALVTDIVDAYRSGKLSDEDGDKLINAVLVSTVETIKSKSYLQGLVNFTTLINDTASGRGGANALSRFVGSFVPAIVASGVQLLGTGGDAIIQTRSMFDGIMARTGFDDTLEVKRNLLGEELRRSDTQVVGLGAFVPTVVSKKRNDPVLQAIADSGVDMGAPATKVDGIDLREIRMPDGRSAYSKYLDNMRDVSIDGATLRGAIASLINSSKYKAAPEDPGAPGEESLRATMIRSVVSKYRRAAKAQLYKDSEEFARQAGVRKDVKASIKSGQTTVAEAIQRLVQNNY